MINPNSTHLLRGIITQINIDTIGLFKIKSGGCYYEGYDIHKRFKVGDKVTFRVNFMITQDKYMIVTRTIRKRHGLKNFTNENGE